MKNLVSRFVKDESGATAIEYGLIAAGISVAIIAVVQGARLEAERPPSPRFRPPSTKRVLSWKMRKASAIAEAFSFCAIAITKPQ